MSKHSILPVILCGGSGSRLWPLSRKSFPKQFLSLNSNSSETLLQSTQQRIKDLKGLGDPILVCSEEHRFLVAEQMREINIKPNSILLEPFPRNTAPAITLAALKAIETGENPILLVLSSDHIIGDQKQFIKVINEGIQYANNDRLVTFGVIPDSPDTGYGYIKSQLPLEGSVIKGSNIISFIEKPDFKTASKLFKDKRFTWNSGIFMFKANTILKEIENHAPDVFKFCEASIREKLYDLDFQRLSKKEFKKCPNVSIDIAVMEKTNLGTVLPLEASWTDVGSWDAVWKISRKDNNNNFIEGKVVTKNTTNCYLKSEKRLITTIGIKDLIIIETSDAILVADRFQSQEVKNVVDLLKQKNISEGQKHKRIYRPWGFYESLIEEERWQVKIINVKPGEKLSLQMHHHRSEHWIVVSGTANVEIDEKEITLHENQSSYIPIGSKHRLSNPGKIPLKLIEVQSGAYLGEDDIHRFDDDYGRIYNK